jgi:hypothetical protein
MSSHCQCDHSIKSLLISSEARQRERARGSHRGIHLARGAPSKLTMNTFIIAAAMAIMAALIEPSLGQPSQERIFNGGDASARDPGGNIAVLARFRTTLTFCTASVLNNEWLVTTTPCLANQVVGNGVQIWYTPSNNPNRQLLVNTTIADFYLDPFHDQSSWLDHFNSGSVAANRFGMFRLADMLPVTCTKGFLCDQTPDVPMNAIYWYTKIAPQKPILSWLARFFSNATQLPAGAFNRTTFTIFGYGGLDRSGSGVLQLRTGSGLNPIPRVSATGGEFWVEYYSDLNLLAPRQSRLCDGDAGAPMIFHARNDTTAVVVAGLGVRGLPKCDALRLLYGWDGYVRFDEADIQIMQTKVERSGGLCQKTDFGGDLLFMCFNAVTTQ